MRKMTHKEIRELGEELKIAKISVLYRYGFSVEEISKATNTPESYVQIMIDTIEEIQGKIEEKLESVIEEIE